MVKVYLLTAMLLTSCEKPRSVPAVAPPRDARVVDSALWWDGPTLDYACGPNQRCRNDQLCIIGSSGSQCMVSAERGIGQYQDYEWSCVDMPPSCHGTPSCSCVSGPGMCSGVQNDNRTVRFGCI